MGWVDDGPNGWAGDADGLGMRMGRSPVQGPVHLQDAKVG